MALQIKFFYCLFVLLLVASTTEALDVACTETYSEWYLSGTCSKACGNCGTGNYVRVCQSGCTCNGPLTRSGPCRSEPCLFPETSCYPPMKKRTIAGKFICA